MYEIECACEEPDPDYKGICANCNKPVPIDKEG